MQNNHMELLLNILKSALILYGEIKFREKIYSLSANLMAKQSKQLFIELHVDR